LCKVRSQILRRTLKVEPQSTCLPSSLDAASRAEVAAYTCGMQYLFIDSNLFLQCRPLEDLDWDCLVGREEVTLLVPSAVLAELDKHKSDGNSRRAQRARRALQFLDCILKAPDDTVIVRMAPVKVIAQFAPEVSGDASTSNDDAILFEVAEMTRTHGNQAVGLVTHDTNLKVKAKRKGLRFFQVPDKWLLAPEPDERDKRVRQLEEEVARLKRQTPIIAITLDGHQEIELVVPSYEPLVPGTVNRLVEALTAKFPIKTDFSLTSSERLLSAGGIGMFGLHPPADWEIAKYQNEEYPKWERSLRGRLEQLHSRLRVRDATTNIRLLIANNGTVPGEHVQVAIRVSEGFLNTDPEHQDKLIERLFTRPLAPSPPQPRQTSLDNLGNLRELSVLTPRYGPEMPIRRNRDKFYRKAGKEVDTEWVWECENMRHGGPPEEFPFRVAMNAQSQPSGGQIEIEVSADNLPKAAVIQFRIKVSNVPADTERAAQEWLGISSH
jgi:rRNA-processing protein FCF1